jgi:hypothetical protein
MTTAVEIPLHPDQFGPVERRLARAGQITVSGFRYASGVAALRILNGAGEVIVLPFHGQQVWDATFLGRRLTMGSLFDEPQDTVDYLGNYGALFLHCGAAAMGNPGPDDRHPLHGELPNARYGDVVMSLDVQDDIWTFTLTGTTRQTRAFFYSYDATARLQIGEGATRIGVGMTITNRQQRAMGMMYLAHVNFRPADGGRFIDTAQDSTALIRNDDADIAHLPPAQRDHALWAPPPGSLPRDVPPPASMAGETVALLRPDAGPDGCALAAQLHPDGTADFVSWRQAELPLAVRWVARNGNEDAAGFALPATAFPDGAAAAARRGQLVNLPPGGSFDCAFEFGACDAPDAAAIATRIAAIRGSAQPDPSATGPRR